MLIRYYVPGSSGGNWNSSAAAFAAAVAAEDAEDAAEEAAAPAMAFAFVVTPLTATTRKPSKDISKIITEIVRTLTFCLSTISKTPCCRNCSYYFFIHCGKSTYRCPPPRDQLSPGTRRRCGPSGRCVPIPRAHLTATRAPPRPGSCDVVVVVAAKEKGSVCVPCGRSAVTAVVLVTAARSRWRAHAPPTVRVVDAGACGDAVAAVQGAHCNGSSAYCCCCSCVGGEGSRW